MLTKKKRGGQSVLHYIYSEKQNLDYEEGEGRLRGSSKVMRGIQKYPNG